MLFPRPASRAMPLVALVVASSFSTPAAASSWSALHKEILSAIDGIRTIVATLPPEAPERQAAIDRLGKMIDRALDPAPRRPRLSRRLATLLPLLDQYEPEIHHVLYGVLERRFGEAIGQLPPAEHKDFFRYVKSLWPRRLSSRNPATIQRMVVGTYLAKLVRSTDNKADVVELVLAILQREVSWVKPMAADPVDIKKAVRLFGRPAEEATIYGVLDAVDAVYDIAFEADPYVVLAPFVTELVHFLARLEVRVKGEAKGSVVPADHDASPSQLRLWFHITSILQKWTGEVQHVWFEDWLKFWALYFSEDRTQQQFDFRKVKGGPGLAERGTRVVRKQADLFGIEMKSSRFLIIVDISGSMKQNTHQIDRMAALKKEAVRFISMLKPGVHYNILPFSRGAAIEASLTKSHKLKAKTRPRGEISPETKRWIESLEAHGQTRVDLAFRTAFQAEESPDPKKVRRVRKPKPPAFTEIYFITDGSPTNHKGDVLSGARQLDLLSFIRGLNARHRVRIHTLGFWGMDRRFIFSLAQQNGGEMRMINLLPKTTP